MNPSTMERSVGMILIIPFGICFILLFLVCCFADEMKKMCILPSQIPPSYRSSSPVFNTSRQNESSTESSPRQNNRLNSNDIENQSLAVEQAETEQLITDDLILTGVDVTTQVNIRTNSSLHYLHHNNMNNNNHNNNYNHQHANNNNVSNNEDGLADSIQQQYHYQSNASRSSSSILLGNGVCINRPSQHSDYVLSRHLGDINGSGVEEVETSLIPPIIFRGSLQHLELPNNSLNSEYPDIVNHEFIASDLMSSRPGAAVSAKQWGINYSRQMQVSVSVNNLSTAHIHHLPQSTD